MNNDIVSPKDMPLWIYLYVFLIMAQIILIFKILSQNLRDKTSWILYCVGTFFSLIGILMCVWQYEISTYITTIIGLLTLYSSFIYSVYGNHIHAEMHFIEIISIALTFYSIYNVFLK